MDEDAGPHDGLLDTYHYSSKDGGEAQSPPGGHDTWRYTTTLKSWVWTVTSATSTIIGRRVLVGFREYSLAQEILPVSSVNFSDPFHADSFAAYPICFLVLLQLIAYCFAANIILIVKLKEIRSPKRKCVPGVRHSRYEKFVLAVRFCVTSFLSTTATICGAEALLLYTNLPVLVALPIFTYALDSLVSRLAHLTRLARLDKRPPLLGLCPVVFVFICIFLIVYEDYRLNPIGLLFALAGIFLFSISKLIPRIGPRIESSAVHTWDCPLYMYLLSALPPLIITSYAALKLEDVDLALHDLGSWGGWAFLIHLVPGGLHHVLFNCAMDTAYPFSPAGGAPGALEDSSSDAKTAIASTLQAGLLVVWLGVYGGERNLVDGVHVLAYTLLYVAAVGPRGIGFYPPRFMNLIARLLRKPQLKIKNRPWQLPVGLCITTTAFIAVLSSGIFYWTDKVAYGRDLKTWTGPSAAVLDGAYIPPQSPSMEMVIAHSNGEPLESISHLVSAFWTVPSVDFAGPRIKIYTKDTTISEEELLSFTISFQDRDVSGAILPNRGGVAATFLHHILNNWNEFPSQTIFLSTSTSPLQLSLATTRARDYFIPTIPLHSLRHSELVTSFLNLGEYETCDCNKCWDVHGWTDTFHLIPSMWGAVRPGAPSCSSVLLTHGNNFIASADSLRAVQKDVWQVLYDGLTNPDMRNAWAHNAGSLPQEKEGLPGDEDSVATPYLGHTIERLWGIMLQCSGPEMAWRCPNTLRGWRRHGSRSDCGCLHW